MSGSIFIKCVTVGDGAVGKTCLLFSHTSNTFPTRKCCVDGSTVNLGLWDTAGNFDTASESPFLWMPELKHYVCGVPIILVGTKLYLRDDQQFFVDHPGAVPMSTAQAQELRKQLRAPAYVDCSSKTQQNVKAVFDVAIKVVLHPAKKNKKKKTHGACSIL